MGAEAADDAGFLQQLAPESRAYHIVRALRLKGEIDSEALRRAFQLLIDRHASLRTVFTLIDGQPVQEVREHVTIFFVEEDASDWNSDLLQKRVAEAARQPFDLSSGPLFKVYLFRCSEDDHRLLLALHHIVADLWSLGLLLTEFPGSSPTAAKFVAPGTRVDFVTVNGEQGEWVTGKPHHFGNVDDQGVFRKESIRLAGNVLLWERHGLVLRLESAVPEAATLRIAASVR